MNSGTKKLVTVLSAISVIVVTGAYFYYRSVNQAEDPRVAKARHLFAKYSRLIEEEKYSLVFIVLDELEDLYKNTSAYADSYELGIVYNNRTATYLLMALYDDKKELLSKAEQTALTSKAIYEKWLNTYGRLNNKEIKTKIEPFFQISKKVLNKRVADIELAQLEVKRRLSVSYTNLGIVQRHQAQPAKAVESQTRALELWPDNHTAKNNLNVLFGKKPKKRSVVDQLFPKPRKKSSKEINSEK
ncbi:hypothetical protein KAR34_13165 [bacterium]|nr:hypothetical protein [bacterium]